MAANCLTDVVCAHAPGPAPAPQNGLAINTVQWGASSESCASLSRKGWRSLPLVRLPRVRFEVKWKPGKDEWSAPRKSIKCPTPVIAPNVPATAVFSATCIQGQLANGIQNPKMYAESSKSVVLESICCPLVTSCSQPLKTLPCLHMQCRYIFKSQVANRKFLLPSIAKEVRDKSIWKRND